MSTATVTYVRPEVTRASSDWKLVTDVVAGSRKIKENTTTYLPQPNPLDLSERNAIRYQQYLDRAVFFGVTSNTLNGLIGIAFRQGPFLTIPTELDFVNGDVDGAGGGINNQSRRILERQLTNGRAGALVDYPDRLEDGTSMSQVQAGEVHATIIDYPADAIINWAVDHTGSLSMVVIHEVIDDPTDTNRYAKEQIEQYRVLLLEDGVYHVELYQTNGTGTSVDLVEQYTPLDAAGQTWEHIPFTFIGATDNDSAVDKAPLLDMANLNIAHYHNSADFEDSLYVIGQPTLVLSGLTQHWVDDVMGSEIYIGSVVPVLLPENGSANIIQPNENTLAAKGMEMKETQMVAIGAQLLTRSSAIKTAEQSRSETAAAHSVLSLAVANMADAYTLLLQWCARFEGVQDIESVQYRMPTDFIGLKLDAQALQSIVAAWVANAIPTSDKNSSLRQIGIIDADKSDDEIRAEIESNILDLEIKEQIDTLPISDNTE